MAASGDFDVDIWSRILSFCIKHDQYERKSTVKTSYGPVPKQTTLARCMRVNSVFNLAAGPHLYRDPVVDELGSFFLNANLPDEAVIPSSRQTKAVLLRGVRHLVIDLSPDVFGISKDWINLIIAADEVDPSFVKPMVIQRQVRSIDQALQTIRSFKGSALLLPGLETLSLGRNELGIDEWRCGYHVGATGVLIWPTFAFTESLLPVCRPRVWCLWPAAGHFNFLSPPQGCRPDLHISHIEDVMHGVFVIWGCENRLIFHRPPLEDASDFFGLWNVITHHAAPCHTEDIATVRATKIKVSINVSDSVRLPLRDPSDFFPTTKYDLSTVVGKARRQMCIDYLAEFIHSPSSTPYDQFRNRRLEGIEVPTLTLHLPEDLPPCPACRMEGSCHNLPEELRDKRKRR